jgi:hypothetical protein
MCDHDGLRSLLTAIVECCGTRRRQLLTIVSALRFESLDSDLAKSEQPVGPMGRYDGN